MNLLSPSLRHALRVTVLSGLAISACLAQSPSVRITTPIVDSSRTTLPGSRSPRALASADAGELPPSTELHGISLTFRRSEAQQAALEVLIAAQQDPSSSQYHQWLTPDQFAARFGMAEADLARVENWLQSQGFSVDSVARSRDRIHFSGTAAQVASAFGSPLHLYKEGTQSHFAPSQDLSVPSALAPVVLGIRNLSDFRPTPQGILKPSAAPATPAFTSSQTGNHFLTPKDLATIYDVTPAYNAGYSGANQSIAVVGQSSVVTTDITRFQALAGVTVKAPTLVLVPGTGSPAVSSGDEAESDLDLEYTSGMAPGASIFFVYTGSNTNYGAFDALSYAITERIAPIISVSYGECEALLGASNFATLNGTLAQAAAQGQTIVSASGDQGSTACFGTKTASTQQQEAVSALYPASSQYVTGLGGTEFPTSTVAATNTTYWTAASGSDLVSSALSYIPEQVWNDDSPTGGVSAGGGGISVYTPRPSWQAGVPGIPTGSFRLVPDVSLTSSPANAPYLFCSSDTTGTGVTGSCANGFRDATSTNLTTGGGTSFAAPVFAGMLALINQARNSTGQGVINPILYSLASAPATYASAFHDITSGTNACTAGINYCSAAGASVYAAATGYDEASGIGSVDLFKLLSAWPTTAVSALQASSTTLSPATVTPASAAADAITITVAPAATSGSTPTGSVSIAVDGTVVNSSLSLSNGVATYSFASSTSGSHVITATYSGDTTYAGSTGTTVVTVGATSGTFSVSAPAITVANGSSSSSTVTVTPANGYTGTVTWSLSTQATIYNACYTINNVAVTGSAPVTTTLTITAGSAQCASTVFRKGSGMSTGIFAGPVAQSRAPAYPVRRPLHAPVAYAFAGLLALGLVGRRSKPLRGLVAIAFVGLLGLGLMGCGDNSAAPVVNSQATTGTFQVTLIGTDTNTSSVTASSTFTLTIH